MGVLASQQIEALIRDGMVRIETALAPGQLQPASLDLRLGGTAYRIRASFLAGKGWTVADRLRDLGMDRAVELGGQLDLFSVAGDRLRHFEMRRIDLSDGAVLEKGCIYLVPLQESLDLPPHLSAVANAKSSTGRLDLLTRTITDEGHEFDRIPAGYSGPLYAEICPRSFSVLVRPGMRLNQIRFRHGQAVLSDDALKALHNETPLVDGKAVIEDGLAFSVDLKPAETAPVGYRAKPHTGVIDLDRIGRYDPRDYWEEVHSESGQIILDPGAFYILVSREAVHVPPLYAAEMAPYLAMVGEFRVHYAGFFDPGFGHDATGGAGSRGVLEVRCHEAPFLLEHEQIVGRLVYEQMDRAPARLYGAGIGSNYQGQGLKLSKHFKTAS